MKTDTSDTTCRPFSKDGRLRGHADEEPPSRPWNGFNLEQMDSAKNDDVRVYNRRLTTADIRDIAGLPQDTTPYYLAEER
ncbi:unnamed protein product [Vitrella brassicaformis CCMP3155]|uniref:Uncharacterized protein n=1 Tax=Vitrella brassicaformis (strain CCMP3155) TaxID=1169540 RepID=A0A0G4GWX4_VITBC|nr:unnamed protein product [Vitrella brassicaformis CCMP3155]|eukprot:CEM35468.1 unnamed protein product [Vitrella brassicaformis CCMP3155]